MGNYTIFQMFENPRRGWQARNITTTVPKILDLNSCSEQIFSKKLTLGAPVLSYPVTIDCIQGIVTSYTSTVYYSGDAVMSYPIASCRAFFQVVQGENMQYGEQLSNLCSKVLHK